MKKVSLILSLSGLLSVLLVSLTASVVLAAPCANSCNAPVSVDCDCEGFGLKAGVHYCWNEQYFSNKEDCLKEKAEIESQFVPAPASALTAPPSGATPILGLPNPLGAGATFETVLDKIINFIFWIGMAVAPVMIIVAGFLYVTSAGNPQKVEQAKKIIIYAIIGLVVLLLAKGLVKVLESVIGVQKVD